ncbi:hypothetical protein H2198_005799 [Neophaeococcomyces mojaviensis]|uniref:Uncharacterized protein n=1 Tax=Neophaeococcomyces mojaviensis TaxID=3383035 RepID=A0ACC3A4Q9_9EURO|nr:hypothetical protein H2198_005799 [Knufia sp. JES_112]
MNWMNLRLARQLRQPASRCFNTSRTYTADHVRIVEVGARDGLQNEKQAISLENKLELIRRLSKTGVTHIEAGSFVPAKWVPQMASTAEILTDLIQKPPVEARPIAYNYLVPNIRGIENLVKIFEQNNHTNPPLQADYPTPPPSPQATPEQTQGQGPITSSHNPNQMSSASNPAVPTSNATGSQSDRNTTEISLFAAATESFSQRNTNCSIAESLHRSLPIIELARKHSVRVRGYVSVALGCPYEGPDVDPHKVAELTASLLEMGCDEVSVADTTGMGTVPKTRKLLQTLKDAGVLMEDVALHFHDTYGQALVNMVVGLEAGVRVFDSSVGGLGGCPYSKGATGNVSTEDTVHLLHSLGCDTGIDLVKMAEVGEWITGVVGKANEGRAGKAMLARMRD